jgi:hypothetical protein
MDRAPWYKTKEILGEREVGNTVDDITVRWFENPPPWTDFYDMYWHSDWFYNKIVPHHIIRNKHPFDPEEVHYVSDEDSLPTSPDDEEKNLVRMIKSAPGIWPAWL